MGVYTSSSCLHQAFSRPLSSLYACNTLSLRHSQNNRPLRSHWPQGPSILGKTQPWGITLQINKCLATRLKSILSFQGSCYSSFSGRNRNIPHNPNWCKIWCQSSNDTGSTSQLCDCILWPWTYKSHQRSPIKLATPNSISKLKRLSWHWKPPWNLHKKLQASPIQPATRIWTTHLNTIECKSISNQYNHLSKQNLHWIALWVPAYPHQSRKSLHC